MNAEQFVADMPLGPGDARANLLHARLLIAYLADHVYTAELANGARVLDASDFKAFCCEAVEVIRKVARLADGPELPTLRSAQKQLPPPGQRRYDPTCNRCGHVHEGVGECGMFMGNGRFCRCEMELTA
jgi:hypothetical protein